MPETLDTSAGALTSRGLFAMFRPDYTNLAVWIPDAAASGGRRLNPEAFTLSTDFRQGTLSRNALRGSGMSQADVSLRREFRLREPFSATLAAQAFNVLNQTSFANRSSNAGGYLNGPFFGVATRQQNCGPRTVQFILQLLF